MNEIKKGKNMRFKFMASAVLACLLLCGCDGGKSSSSEKPSAAVTASSTEITSETAETTPETTVAAQTTKANTAPEADIDLAEEQTKAPVTTAAAATEPAPTEAPAQTTTAAASEAQKMTNGVDNGNDLPDDGLDWSPLVPVE